MSTRWLTILLVAGLAGGAGYYYLQHPPTGKLDVQTVAANFEVADDVMARLTA